MKNEKTMGKHLQNQSCARSWPRHPLASALWGERERRVGHVIQSKVDPNVNLDELAKEVIYDKELKNTTKRRRRQAKVSQV